MRALLLFLILATPALADSYFGTQVPDTYRWLENTDDPAVKAWSHVQDGRARAFLDALPVRQKIHDRLMALLSKTSPSFVDLVPAGGHIFALYSQPPKQQPMVAMLGPDADPATLKLIVDPNVLNPAGTTAIDWFAPSPDGTRVAVSLSDNGSEDGSVHVFDVATGRQTGETIPRVQFPTGGGSLAWAADGTGFWYTRYPGPAEPAERQHFYQQVFYHRLGDDPAADAYVAGRDFPKVAEIVLDNRQNPGQVLMSVANGDGGQYAHYVISPGSRVTQVTHFTDQVVAGAIGPDGMLYMVSRAGAPHGKLLVTPAAHPDLAAAKLLVPESDGVLQEGGEFGGEPVTITAHAIYLRELVGGPSRVAAYTPDGRRLPDLKLPDPAAVAEVTAIPGDALLYSVATYLKPAYFERFDERTGAATESALAQHSPVSFTDATVSRVFATSRDGTRVPVNIVQRNGTQTAGANPTLLYGYGGYSVSLVPHFLGAGVRLWLDGGGVYAEANIRGGGEYGATWHDQGALTHKQNVFDDFFAASQLLIAQKITSPAHLAILGGSNGGLLMGAELTQHPAQFRAVVSLVGIYDMLRVELDPNGLFNTTEFGTVKNQAQFDALYAYSPYHHVARGTAYPAVFMATGEHDGRVNPMHSRKMMAALQAASSSGLPLLLSINSHAGHGIGSALSIRVDQQSDWLAFLYDQLGMELKLGE